MSEIKITDLVPQETIDKIKELDKEIKTLLDTYTNTAKELARGVDVNVRVVGDIDKLEKLLVEKSKEATVATEKLNAAIAAQGQLIAQTTNTISRQLMEQERVNKTTREAYAEQEKVKKLLEHYHDTYEGQINQLVKVNAQLNANKKAQKDNEKALSAGRVTMAQYQATQAELIAQQRDLAQQKRTLNQLLTAEEKAAQSTEGSYAHMSQQLELLKKAYKGLSEEGRGSEFGKELETTIQNLDAHLKDVAADMGEFQRNVGNYAIAGQNGVVSTESLMAVLQQQAVTTKDVADQSKILLEARSMLDTSDANYSQTVTLINNKLAENRKRIADVSDIMNVQATTVADAEAQNKRLQEALKQVDQSSAGAESTIKALNAKIEENNKVIAAGSGGKSGVKKDLKEMVMEIANLTIAYNKMSEAEKSSAEGKELKNKITELTEKAGELRDAINDTNQAISHAASDTRGFDQLTGGLQLAIDSFGLATGAAAMLGVSEGELAVIQTKLQGAIAASNAMSKIQLALQKQSVVMQAVSNLQLKAAAIAIKLKTAAEGKGVVTTKLLTAAQWLFNAAANANPIGLIVVAITACIAAVYGLIKAFSLFSGDSEARKKKYEDEAQALENMKKQHEKAIAQAEARGASEWEAANMAIDAKLAEMAQAERAYAAAKRAYEEDEEEYKAALEAKKEATEDYNATLEDSHNKVLAFIQKYRDREREEAIGTSQFKKEQAEKDFAEQYDLLIKYYGKRMEYYRTEIELDKWFMEHSIDGLKGYHQANIDINQSMIDALTKQLDGEINGLISAKNQIIDDAQAEQDKKDADAAKKATDAAKRAEDARRKHEEAILKEIRKARKMELELTEDASQRKILLEQESFRIEKSDLQKRINELAESETKMREALQDQIRFLTSKHNRTMEELQAEADGNRAKLNKEILQSELDTLKDTSAQSLDLRKRIAEEDYNIAVAGIKKRVAKCELTEDEGEQLLLNLLTSYHNNVEQLTNEHAAKVASAVEKKYSTEQEMQNNAFILAQNKLKQRYAREIQEAQGNAAKQAQIKAKYEADSAKLSEDYSKQTAANTVAMIEEVLKNEQLSAEDRLKYEQQLAKAKADYERAAADASIAQIERVTDADNQASEKRRQNAQQWLQVAADSLNTISELVATVYDAKISKVEEEQEANTAAGEAEQERISELVEKKVITEEEGEARKRAAEAKTAKKNEELEKKKQQLKHKQAVWDKANGVAQAGIATALAIMNALQMQPFPVGIAMAAIAGAMGAVQIATILATPIPKYAKGTDKHQGGPAIVGDGGKHEVIVLDGAAWMTPDTPTLVNIPEGASVIPDIRQFNEVLPTLIDATPQKDTPHVIVNNDYKRLEEKMDAFLYAMRKHSNRQYQATLDQSLNQFIASKL